MASWDVLLFVFSLVDGLFLLFLSVYFIITLSDLECDYINAQQCCIRLNQWVLVDVMAHGVLVMFQFFTWHWFLMLLNLPIAVWQHYSYLKIPSGNIGKYDPTEIHNRQNLKFHMKEGMVKLGFHLVFFFIYLYSMIYALVGGEESA